jgi:hypothetical protein
LHLLSTRCLYADRYRAAYQDFTDLLLPIIIAIVMMFVSRPCHLSSIGLVLLTLRISFNHQHILFVVACGALALALAWAST